MQQSTFEFSVSSDSDVLNLQVKINGQTHWQGYPTKDAQTVSVMIDDGHEADHVLELVMSGKTPEHTVLDADGNVISDMLMHIKSIQFEGIDVTQIFFEQSRYNHDFNGTQPPLEDRFYGDIGCNGTVTLKFSTPIYLWLLENM